ncbi:hypothetical protein ACEXQD_10650 [Herbiconiux sp. P15]|uniref:hypothetical protein n=1 Tax=Herbiconiux liukaitaii TaxID=3342799 RepID=UPI0035BB7BDE
MRIRSTLSRLVALVVTTAVLLGTGAVAASASALAGDADPQPTLAQTGYDFTPMLVVAAVFLVIAGVTVVVAKYAVSRSSHS